MTLVCRMHSTNDPLTFKKISNHVLYLSCQFYLKTAVGIFPRRGGINKHKQTQRTPRPRTTIYRKCYDMCDLKTTYSAVENGVATVETSTSSAQSIIPDYITPHFKMC